MRSADWLREKEASQANEEGERAARPEPLSGGLPNGHRGIPGFPPVGACGPWLSVFCRMLYVIDDNHFDRAGRGFDDESKLLLNRTEE